MHGKDSANVRVGSAPNFCPPVREGVTISLEDEHGDTVEMEFLGLLLEDNRRWGFFFPIDDGAHPLESGEVVLLEVVELDEDGQPCGFELVEDEVLAQRLYASFKKATKDLYRFE